MWESGFPPEPVCHYNHPSQVPPCTSVPQRWELTVLEAPRFENHCHSSYSSLLLMGQRGLLQVCWDRTKATATHTTVQNRKLGFLAGAQDAVIEPLPLISSQWRPQAPQLHLHALP